MFVGRTDNLPVAVMERVEQMEKFFLDCAFFGEELHIVHDEYVAAAEFFFKRRNGAVINRAHEFKAETFSSEIKNFFCGVQLFYMIPYRLHEVCFSAACFSVNEKRVIRDAGVLYDRVRGRVCKFIKRTHDECVKCIARVQVIRTIYEIVRKRQL